MIFCSLILSSCATTTEYKPANIKPAGKEGVYHKVKKGDTVWQLAKVYDVRIEDIILSNNIPNVAHIEENQLVLIPGRTEIKEVKSTQIDPRADEFSWPIKGKIIKYFGERNKANSYKGIRIQSQAGNEVHASRKGKVIFADYLRGYNYTIILDHLDGYFSVYSQNSEIVVKLGAVVDKGDIIALIDHRNNAAYLHFEIRKNTTAENPVYYLPRL